MDHASHLWGRGQLKRKGKEQGRVQKIDVWDGWPLDATVMVTMQPQTRLGQQTKVTSNIRECSDTTTKDVQQLNFKHILRAKQYVQSTA